MLNKEAKRHFTNMANALTMRHMFLVNMYLNALTDKSISVLEYNRSSINKFMNQLRTDYKSINEVAEEGYTHPKEIVEAFLDTIKHTTFEKTRIIAPGPFNDIKGTLMKKLPPKFKIELLNDFHKATLSIYDKEMTIIELSHFGVK